MGGSWVMTELISNNWRNLFIPMSSDCGIGSDSWGALEDNNTVSKVSHNDEIMLETKVSSSCGGWNI